MQPRVRLLHCAPWYRSCLSDTPRHAAVTILVTAHRHLRCSLASRRIVC